MLGGEFPIRFIREYHSISESIPEKLGIEVGVFGGTVQTEEPVIGNHWDHSYLSHLDGGLNVGYQYLWTTPLGGDATYLEALQDLYDSDPNLFNTYIKLYRPNGLTLVFTNTYNPSSKCFTSPAWDSREAGQVYSMRMNDECAGISTREYTVDNGEHYEVYDSTGKLIELSSYSGIKHIVSYQGDNISQIAHSLGHALDFTYVNDKLDKITDESGRVWGYEYAANKNLEYVYYPDATFTRYYYDDLSHPQALTAVDDRRGVRFSNFSYVNDKATASYRGPQTLIAEDRIGGIVLSYDLSFGIRNTITNSKADVTDYWFSDFDGYKLLTSVMGVGCADCAASDITYDYDVSTLNLNSITEYGQKTEYSAYNVDNMPQVVTEAAQTTNQRQKSYAYHPNYLDKPMAITEPSVKAGENKVTTLGYDLFGNITQIKVDGFKPDGSPVSRVTDFVYNGPYHQLTEIDGPRNDVDDKYIITYYPDTPAEGNNRARRKSITAPEGVLLFDSMQYTPTGKQAYYTSGNNMQVNFDYYPGNDRLQTLTVTDADLGAIRKTHWTYLATGEVETITQGYQSIDANTITFTYDDARRLERVTDGLGNYIKYTLDTEGNVEQEELFDNNDSLHKQLTQTFDAYNRLDTQSQVNESIDTLFKPDGNLDELVDGKTTKTKYAYDDLRRLTSITQDEGGTDPATQNALTQIGYDTQDNITSVTDPNGGVTTYSYDDLGNLLSIDSPDTGLTVYTHDEAGNIATMTDAKAQQTTYSYDALNRVISIDMPGTEHDINFSYDSCQKGNGRLCSVSNATSTQHYVYDAEGNILSHQSLQYSYDAASRVNTIHYPSGAIVDYDYDQAGQVGRVSLTRNGNTTVLADNIQHDPFGPVNSLQYGNNLNYTQVNDAAYRVLSQDAGSAQDIDYNQYDANGNLQTRTDNLSASIENYTYDLLDRLDTGAGMFGSRDYGYDKNGNRTQLNDGSITNYAYAPASNRVDSINATAISLDANGNTETRPTATDTQTLSYTPHNRLLQVHDSSGLLASYVYNGLGQRISKQRVDGSGRQYFYGIDGKLLVETDINGNILHEYIFMDEQLLARYDADSNSDGNTNIREDELGTNPASPDDDGDGLSNLDEMTLHGTDPSSADTDGDGLTDQTEINNATDPLQASSNPLQLGDINMDGNINTGDLVLLQQFVLETRVPDAQQAYLADINQDTLLDVRDMLLLTQQVLNTASNDALYLNTLLQSLASWALEQIPAAMAAPGDGEIYYIHSDHLGTPKTMSDEIGQTVWSASHAPFGLATVDEDPDNDGRLLTLNIRFPGQYYDSETGLHYNYFRTYDPLTGRYITSDPIGIWGDINTYSYAEGNPISIYDPFGLFGIADLPKVPQGVTDAFAGFGDGISFGLTNHIRDSIGANDQVDKCSAAFNVSEVVGNFVLPSAGALKGLAFLGGTRRGSQILNRNPFFRIGPGRMPANGSLPAGPKVPRISIGRGPGNPHIDLRVRVPFTGIIF